MGWLNSNKHQQELAEFNAEWAEAHQEAINEYVDEVLDQADHRLSIHLGNPHADRPELGSSGLQCMGSLLAGYGEL